MVIGAVVRCAVLWALLPLAYVLALAAVGVSWCLVAVSAVQGALRRSR